MKNAAEALYNVLDGLTGEIVEKGWEGLDRYYKNPFRMYLGLIDLLKVLDKEKGKELEDQAIKFGVVEVKKEVVYNKED